MSTSTGDVKVTFQASANAASYEIYRRIGNGAAKKIGTVTKLSYVDNKPAGKNVKIVEKKGKVYSPASKVRSVKIKK